MRRPSPRSRAFTLVELGVVIGVIAVLMGFSVTRMKGFRENAAFERIANDMQGLARVGVMYLERQGTNVGYINVTMARPTPAKMVELLPPGFSGLNPLNNQPYQIQVANPFVRVRTLLPPNSHFVNIWDPTIEIMPPTCRAGCWARLQKRWLPPASMIPLLMEKRYLYRDCCCAGTCPCGPIPAWYCP